MFKMATFLPPLFLLFLCISVSGQQMLQISTTNPLQQNSYSLGVSVNQNELNEVSNNILAAETWLRTHVLPYYPSTNITTIIVTNNNIVLEEKNASLILLAMGNIYHSLVRWGLEKKIKVSVILTPKCLLQPSVKSVLKLLKEINSTYYLYSTSDLGVFRSKSNTLNVMTWPRSERKLMQSVPSDVATAPLPPLVGVTSPPPERQSPVARAPAPNGFDLPPCNPYPNPKRHRGGGGGMAAPPVVGGEAPPLAREELWCVAKPSVPSEKLQEGIDYACGEGGADCGPISPSGSCYFPDSIVSHASYAFNSYWQRNKKNGGTCGFGGTAMLINSDPSFLQCHFSLA